MGSDGRLVVVRRSLRLLTKPMLLWRFLLRSLEFLQRSLDPLLFWRCTKRPDGLTDVAKEYHER